MYCQLLLNNEYRSACPLLFIKRCLFTEFSLSFVDGLIHEDEIFTATLFNRPLLSSHLHETLYYRRIRDGSITSEKGNSKNFIGISFAYNLLKEYYSDNPNAVGKHMARFLKINIKIFHGLNLIEKKLYKSQFKADVFYARSNDFFENKRLWLMANHFYLWRFKSLILQNIKTFKIRLKVIIKFRTTLLKLEEKVTKRILIFGTPQHGNLGDHAIVMAMYEYIKDNFADYQVAEVPMPLFRNDLARETVVNSVQNSDIIFIPGGGWLGNLWQRNENTVRDILGIFPNNKIVIFPQTVFFEDNRIGKRQLTISKKLYRKHSKLVFFLRDKKSYDLVTSRDNGYNLENNFMCPDIALYLDKSQYRSDSGSVAVCFRTDIEKVLSDELLEKISGFVEKHGMEVSPITTIFNGFVSEKDRNVTVNDKLKEFASFRLVITDRLHGMIFCAITQTPCIVFDNKTQKVSGVFEWIKDLGFIKFVRNYEEFETEFLNINKHCINKINFRDKFNVIQNIVLGENLEVD